MELDLEFLLKHTELKEQLKNLQKKLEELEKDYILKENEIYLLECEYTETLPEIELK